MPSIAIDRLDGLSSATAMKGPCRVATTANITLSGEQTIDGVAVVDGDRVLVKDQTDARENGIYVADTGNWARAKDFSRNRDVQKGTRVVVTDGTAGAGDYSVSTDNPIQIGASNIAFGQAIGSVPAQARDPIVIFATGQSNVANTKFLDWEPASNVYFWAEVAPDSGVNLGTEFVAMPNDTTNFANRFASDVAKANPTRNVYLVRVGRSGRPIAHWLPSAPDPDMYAISKANVEAALAALGLDHIDMMVWWQGESDHNDPSNYVANFEAVIDRYKAETWFPLSTPIAVMGVTSKAISGDDTYRVLNLYLQQCVHSDPEHRQYIYTAGVVPPDQWDGTLHITAEGHDTLGQTLALNVLYGASRPTMPGLLYDPETDLPQRWKDQAASTKFSVRNESAVSGALTDLEIKSAYGALLLRAYGASLANNAEVSWDAPSVLYFSANNANGQIRWKTANTVRMHLSSAGALGVGTTSPDRRLHSEVDDASNSGVTYAERLTHTTSGTPGNGIGVGMEFEVETSASNNEIGATVEAVVTDATAASEDFDLVFKLMAAGAAAAEKFRVKSTGEPVFRPPSSAAALGTNGEVTIELTNNTTLTFKARGSDGVTRSATLTLA